MKHVYILLTILLLSACTRTLQSEPEQTAVTRASEYDFSGVHLRLHNQSGQDLAAVELIVGGQTKQIGSLPQAAASDYVTFTAVQSPPTIRATGNQTMYEWTAELSAAEGFIAGGQFTLELTLENDQLVVAFLMENPILQDAQHYADEMGVTLAEALARMNTQSGDVISALQNQLQANEADTFAGLWLQHEPDYRVVVAFTQNGEETIRKYVADDSELASMIEIRPAQYTYAQLEADQQEAFRILNALNLPAGGGIMVMDNRVVIDITDKAAFEAALANADATLPGSVVVNTVYESVGENPPFAITPVPDVFMAQLQQRDVAFMEALLIGDLMVQDGCLRINSENESHLVIWQADYFLTDNDGVLEILDETGAVVARVGEMVYMGGGEQRAVNDAELRQPVPEACSSGPYWRMGQFLPEEYIPNVSTDLPPQTSSTDKWLSYTVADTGLGFDYPADWFVHEAGKALQITPNAQPIWSSIFDPDQPHGGPAFDLMHNLNRQMGPTPLAEVENLLQAYEADIEAIEPAAKLADRPDVVMGVYRFTVDDDTMTLLVGTAVNPIPNSPQPVIAMTALVKLDELSEMQPIFEAILRSIRLADPMPEATAVPIDTAAIQTGAPLLFARDNDLWRADSNGQNEQRLTEGQLLADWFALTESGDPWWWGGFPPQIHISPDGRWLVFTQNGHNLVLVDVTSTEATRISPLSETALIFTWSPDSRQFVFGRNTLKLYDVATNAITNLLSGYGQGVHNPVWSPDGRFLAFACCFTEPDPGPYEGVLAGEIRQLELASGQVETVGETWNSVGGGTPDICWAADGTVGIDVVEPVTCSFNPQSMGVLPGDTRYAYFFIQSPDENELFHWLAVKDQASDAIFWEREVPFTQRVHWSPDGQWLYLGNDYYYVEQAAIYRLLADGSGEAEMLLPNALLLDVIPAWQ